MILALTSQELNLKLSRRGAGNRDFYHGVQMIRSVRPEDSPENEGIHRWTYNEIAPNTSHRGWIAGKPFGAFLHFLAKKSEPCRERMTGHAIKCPHCATGNKPQWRGYVPYYDEEYTRRFVLIAPDYLESVAELEHLAPIVIQRGKSKVDPVIIKTKLWRTTPIPHSADRERPVDLARFCVVVLWKDDVLCAWDNAERKKDVPEPATPKPSKGKPKSNGYTAAHKLVDRLTAEANADEPLNVTYARLLKKVEPSTNGHHTKTDDKAD